MSSEENKTFLEQQAKLLEELMSQYPLESQQEMAMKWINENAKKFREQYIAKLRKNK